MFNATTTFGATLTTPPPPPPRPRARDTTPESDGREREVRDVTGVSHVVADCALADDAPARAATTLGQYQQISYLLAAWLTTASEVSRRLLMIVASAVWQVFLLGVQYGRRTPVRHIVCPRFYEHQ